MATVPIPVWNGCTAGAPVSGGTSIQDLRTAAGITADAAGAAGGIMGALAASSTIGLATGIGTAVVGMVSLGYAIASIFSGCGSSCTIASQDANPVETKLNAVLSAYNSAPVHYRSLQRGALTIIVGAFQALCNACSNPSLGSAGQRCISERLIRGASAPWCPTHTGCDWVTTYYDPIANDKSVQADPVQQAPGISNTTPSGQPTQPQGTGPTVGTDSSLYIVIAALLGLAVLKKARG